MPVGPIVEIINLLLLLLLLGPLRSRSGLIQVWFSLGLKFKSFERDSEVGQLNSGVLMVRPDIR